MRIAVCDDEQKVAGEIADRISGVLKAEAQEAQIDVFDAGSALWERLCSEEYELVFLDIDMPDISGMDIAAKMMELGDKPLLVFVTSHDELVYDSLKFHPFGFVRKHLLGEELPNVCGTVSVTWKSKNVTISFRHLPEWGRFHWIPSSILRRTGII